MIKQKKALLIAGGIMLAGWTFVGYEKYSVVQNNGKVQEYVKDVYKLDDVMRIDYTESETTTLAKSGNTWHNTAFPYLDYDQSLINDWIEVIQSLTTKEIVKNVQDLSQYGINEHSAIITLYDSKNQKQTLKLGRISKTEDCLYIETDNDKLYTLSYDESKKLLTRPNDFIKCDEVLKIPEVHKVNINYKNEKPIELVKKDKWYLNHYYNFDVAVQEAVSSSFEQLLSEMKVSRYVGTFDDLKPYGLVEPEMTLTINDMTIIDFGNQMGEDIYVRLNNGKDVYVMDKAFVNEIRNFKPAKAIDEQVIHIDRNAIEEITLSNPQGVYNLKFITEEKQLENKGETPITEEMKEEVKTEENQVEEIKEDKAEIETQAIEKQEVNDSPLLEAQKPIVATMNDIELTEEMAQESFEAIKSSLCIEAPLNNPNIEQKQERKSEATFTFKLKDQSVIQIDLIPYDINYYILRYNGTTEFAVNKDKVTTLFNELTKAIKN